MAPVAIWSPKSPESLEASTCSPSTTAASPGTGCSRTSVGRLSLERSADLQDTLTVVRVLSAWRLAVESVQRAEAEAEALQLGMEISELQHISDDLRAEKMQLLSPSSSPEVTKQVSRSQSHTVLQPQPVRAEERKCTSRSLRPSTSTGALRDSRSYWLQHGSGAATAREKPTVPTSSRIEQMEMSAKLQRWKAAGRPNATRSGSAARAAAAGKGVKKAAGREASTSCTRVKKLAGREATASCTRIGRRASEGAAAEEATPERRCLSFGDPEAMFTEK
eukprot:TRINITY_DN106023_c0_g1_i1.p1 TRINITY_DN106023_c0_g1~~TRINITY_DN106023_c0_g1_i1.p1  ORF type:complete len:278 (-),score=55.15 TRINITY_DN106023_c0_g1_i1:51-884(-)